MANDQQTTMPYTALWVALQEVGACLDALGDLPDWARDLSCALIEAEEPAKAAALAEDLPDA
jgi:hypothetical protein